MLFWDRCIPVPIPGVLSLSTSRSKERSHDSCKWQTYLVRFLVLDSFFTMQEVINSMSFRAGPLRVYNLRSSSPNSYLFARLSWLSKLVWLKPYCFINKAASQFFCPMMEKLGQFFVEFSHARLLGRWFLASASSVFITKSGVLLQTVFSGQPWRRHHPSVVVQLSTSPGHRSYHAASGCSSQTY